MKKHMMTGLMLLVMAAFAFTGCGRQKENVFEPRLDTDADVVLSTTGFFGNFEALDQVIADFNQYYPNIEFTYEQNGIENFEDYVKANETVDIMMTSEEIFENSGDVVRENFADLSKEDIDLSDIDEKMLQRGYHDGELSAIPMGQNIYGLVVNVSLLEKEGLKVPETYDEFLSVLTALKEKGYAPIQGPSGKVYAELVQGMAYDMILNDKTLYQDLLEGKEEAAEKLLPVFAVLDEIVENGFTDLAVNEEYPNDNYDQAILKFFEGDVPFWVCNSEKVSGMKKRESKSEAFQNNPFTYTYIYAPLGEKGVYAYKEPWFGFSVNKNSKNYDYAVEFIRFLATRNEINTIANIKGVPSVAKESENIDVYRDVVKPAKVELTCVNDGTITPGMINNWYSCVNQYMAGEYTSAREALDDFASMCSR